MRNVIMLLPGFIYITDIFASSFTQHVKKSIEQHYLYKIEEICNSNCNSTILVRIKSEEMSR